MANGYGGYAGAADDFDGRDGYGRDGYGRDGYGRDGYGRDGYGRDGYGQDGYGQDGYGQDGYGYQRSSAGYAEPQGGYADVQDGYDWASAATPAPNGYDWSAPDGYGGGAYLGPGSYVEPGPAYGLPGAHGQPCAHGQPGAHGRPDAHRARRGGLPGTLAGRAGTQAGGAAARADGRRGHRTPGHGVVIGVSTLAAALLKSAISPVSAMGAVFTDRTPAVLRNAVVHHFGTHGRTVLLLGMYAMIAVVAIMIGAPARRDAALGVAGVAAFALIAAFVTITRPASHVADVMPAVIGGLAGVAALLWLVRASAPQMTQPLRPAAGGGTRRRTR